MGREAICKCDWAGTIAEVKALLESNEIILRGAIRKRVPFNQLEQLSVRTDRLCFNVAGEPVQLFLGTAIADKWAATITSPPTPLSRKLGITSSTVVRTIGAIEDRALEAALAEAARISSTNADLIVACVDTPESLHAALKAAQPQLKQTIPIWFVYRKGPGLPLNESQIRSLLRFAGMMDTKVASVSAKLTALRFNQQKPR